MKLLQDLWTHLKEWSDWGMKDWIKAGIVALVVIIILAITIEKTTIISTIVIHKASTIFVIINC